MIIVNIICLIAAGTAGFYWDKAVSKMATAEEKKIFYWSVTIFLATFFLSTL